MGVRQIGWARIRSLINENQNQLKFRNLQVVDVAGATTLTAGQSGAVVLLNQAAATYDVTLPASEPGLSFTFVINVMHGSNGVVFNILRAGSDIIHGKSVVQSTTDNKFAYQRAEIAGNKTKVVFQRNSANTGGREGDTVTLVCSTAGQWIASCSLTTSDTTPDTIATLA